MPATDKAKEIKKLTATANDTSRTPEVRLLAARKLLRETNHSARSIRVAKRIAKLYFADEAKTPAVRKRAASLLEFTISAHESDEEINAAETAESLQPQSFLDMFAKRLEVPKKSHAEQLAEQNADWNVYKYNPYLELEVPAQWIYYRTLEDLAAYSIPADPRLMLKGHLLETLKLFIDGDLYYVEPDLWWEKVSNPLYLKALNGRKVNWSGCRVDWIDADGKIIKNSDGQIS